MASLLSAVCFAELMGGGIAFEGASFLVVAEVLVQSRSMNRRISCFWQIRRFQLDSWSTSWHPAYMRLFLLLVSRECGSQGPIYTL